MESDQQFEAVNKAFSRQSANFDQIDSSNLILQWMRKQVRKHVLSQIKPNSLILELNAGTGLDAIYFASHGHSVYATDISEGMVDILKEKIDFLNLNEYLKADLLSFTELRKLRGMQFDYIFSNFGGLNCVPDIGKVIDQFRWILKPGGIVTLVVMPKISPWEIITLLNGNFKLALRRFKENGAISNLEGITFKTYYFNPGSVVRSFGNNYQCIALQGLGSIVPPPHFQNFPLRNPKLFYYLTKMEEIVSNKFIFRSFADHFILTMQYIAD